MTANLKRYTIGERVKEWPANSWNRMVDVAERAIPINPPGELGGITQNVVPVKNVSTTDIPKGGVMMPTGSLLDISDGEKTAAYGSMLSVDVPDLSLGAETTYLIASSPVGQGIIGSGIRYGYAWAKVDIQNESDEFAIAVDADASKLESTTTESRARIIEKESGTGEKWALLDLSVTPSLTSSPLPYLHDTFTMTQWSGSNMDVSVVTPGKQTDGEDIHAAWDAGSSAWLLETGRHYFVVFGATFTKGTGWTAYNPPTTYIESVSVRMHLTKSAGAEGPLADQSGDLSNFSTILYLESSAFIATTGASPTISPFFTLSNGYGITGSHRVNGTGFIIIASIDALDHVPQ